MAAGFQPKKIYEVVYTAKDPPVVGVGPAAIRDTVSKLKFGSASELGIPVGAIKRAIAFGISQSGRFLRTYLYYGFNEDEAHRNQCPQRVHCSGKRGEHAPAHDHSREREPGAAAVSKPSAGNLRDGIAKSKRAEHQAH